MSFAIYYYKKWHKDLRELYEDGLVGIENVIMPYLSHSGEVVIHFKIPL